MLKGAALTSTSTLGIITPSSCEDAAIIDSYLIGFSKLGFKIKLGKHIYSKNTLFAGTDIERATDINSMFADKTVDGIICLRGGYGAIRTLPYIDNQIIKNNPKFFCGFSDITILLNYFAKLGLITFHGPLAKSNFADPQTLNSFIALSTLKNHSFSYDLNSLSNIKYINETAFTGKVVGGNLSVICSSIGTPYQIDTTDSILLIEDLDEEAYVIDRMLTQLKLAGFFKKCNGIIVGYLSNAQNYFSDSSTYILEQTVTNCLQELNIPIILGFPFGHNYPNLTIPIGCTCEYSDNIKSLSFSLI